MTHIIRGKVVVVAVAVAAAAAAAAAGAGAAVRGRTPGGAGPFWEVGVQDVFQNFGGSVEIHMVKRLDVIRRHHEK